MVDLQSLEMQYKEGVKRLVAQLTEMRQQGKDEVVGKLEDELNDLQERKSKAGRRIEDLLRNQIIPGRKQERGLA